MLSNVLTSRGGQDSFVMSAAGGAHDEPRPAITRSRGDEMGGQGAWGDSRPRLEEVLEVAAEGIWDWHVCGGRVIHSPHWLAALGIVPGSHEIEEALLARIHPADREGARRDFEALLGGETGEYHAEYRLLGADGQITWVRDRGRVVERDERGRPLRATGSLADITELRQARAQQQECEAKYRRLVENLAPNYFFYANDENNVFTFVSDSIVSILGWTPKEFLVHYQETITDHPINDEIAARNAAGFAGIRQPPGVVVALHKDGSERWLETTEFPLFDEHGKVVALEGVARDITELKLAEARLQLAASVFTSAREGIMITDAGGNIIDVNETFTSITGYGRDEAVGRNPRILRSGRHDAAFYAAMWRGLIEDSHWQGEVWNRRKSGEEYAESLIISAVHDSRGRVEHYVALFSDITSQKRYQHQLEHIAHYDALTGLPNRVLLADRMQLAMTQTRRRDRRLVVAYLDLDGFKAINDQHGHDVGDQLLTTLAARLKSALREGDTIARLGGDEFVAVFIDLPDVQACVPLIVRLLAAAAQPVHANGLGLRVSGSIGVSVYPQAEEVGADQLLRQADQAMYQAKLAGKNRYHVFDAARDQNARGHRESLARIRQGLEGGEFVLHYQPKVNLRTGEIVGVEALIRWQHPEHGLLAPAVFLSEVEEHPLGVELGEWVLDAALAQVEAWRARGLDLAVSVNVSAHHLQQADFATRLGARLADHPEVKRGRLELEVLETGALGDMAHVSALIATCAEMGVGFAFDDFGTGHSSLTYLRRLPGHVLKIDRSFVRDMLDDPEDLAILEGVLGLAAAFRRKVVAEGMETRAHAAMLLLLGCELAQGYGIARPMPGGELPAWVAAWRPDPAWQTLSAASREDLPLLHAAVEQRAWIGAVESYLRGERERPPAPDQGARRLETWWQDNGRARFGDEPGFAAVSSQLPRLHALVADLLELKARGRGQEALGRAGELGSLRDSVLAQLIRLLQQQPCSCPEDVRRPPRRGRRSRGA